MPLNRPLGVPDVPTPREFGFWELMLPAAGNDEFRKAKMQAIMNEFARSNLGNIMESWRSGGKGWIAPRSIFREDVRRPRAACACLPLPARRLRGARAS